eukprot:TRINITY_DN15879_c0_g1_i1.p1 TRINITY_DN15879_c0_g1~~TRINITY_DN15879_c0_g1_i1.p1  ORF type:complete len:412 (-),score=67.02 TRINITY_DN15879_c0_g1_i1:113-1348(-)
MALAWAQQNPDAGLSALLLEGSPAAATGSTASPGPETGGVRWPSHYKSIDRVKASDPSTFLQLVRPYVDRSEPLVIEGCNVIDLKRWQDLGFIGGLLKDRKLVVKRSPNNYFRYFDLKKNKGQFDFQEPVFECKQTLPEFMQESERLFGCGSAERMYLQETMSGHEELAEEFSTWNWTLLIEVTKSFGWGLPDSNELFIGMQGVETPLHFDERENLFYQVRGRKEVCLFSWSDYDALYPFPTTHPCDRQSMVGSPRSPDRAAFPNFPAAVGHVSELAAGDLLYIPHGWWHWLRNVDNLAVSMSFWSLTPPFKLPQNMPEQLPGQLVTRVKRNLENLIADSYGPRELNATMLRLKRAILDGDSDDRLLGEVHGVLNKLSMPVEKQDELLLQMVTGRFGIDWQRHVIGGGLAK